MKVRFSIRTVLVVTLVAAIAARLSQPIVEAVITMRTAMICDANLNDRLYASPTWQSRDSVVAQR